MFEHTVVVVSYNTYRFTLKAVETVLGYTPGTQVIIVDNASRDSSVSELRARFGNRSEVSLLVNTENVGYGRACNQGIRASSSPYITIMNADCEVTPNWWPPIRDLLQDKTIFAVAPKLVDFSNRIVGCGVVGSNSNPKIRGWLTPDSPAVFNEQLDCISVCGALFSVTRDNLDKIGLFDERFFLYYEETDLMYRARSKGLRVVYTPKSTCKHRLHGCGVTSKTYKHFAESKRIFESIWGPCS